MNRIASFHPAELAHAIAFTQDGLPVFPPKPMRIASTPVIIHRHTLYLACRRCNERLMHGQFDFIKAAHNTHPVCFACINTRQTTRPSFIPRRVCLNNEGHLRVFCKPCGKYLHPDKIEPSRIHTIRSICRSCHERELAAKKRARVYAPARKLTRARSTRQCSKCHMFSTARCRNGVCSACVAHLPVFRHAPSRGAKMANLNAFALLNDTLLASQRRQKRVVR